jgi:hypothetical protein
LKSIHAPLGSLRGLTIGDSLSFIACHLADFIRGKDFLTLTTASLNRGNTKAIYRIFSVNRLFLEAAGIEPAVRVLQFCTVGSANANHL